MGSGRDHHLAEFHLRRFSFDGVHIWQMDLKTGELKVVSTKDAAIAANMNTVMRNGVRDRSLETIMAEQESAVAPLLEALGHHPTGRLELNEADNALLAEYVTLTYARSPQWRDGMTMRARQVMVRMADDLEDSEAVATAIEANGGRFDAAADATRTHILSELRLGRVPAELLSVNHWPIAVDVALNRSDVVVQMSKFLIRRNTAPWIVLGDCAVVLMHDKAFYQPSGLGFGREDVRVVMPINSNAFLVCSSGPLSDRAAEAWRLDGFADLVTRASVGHSARFVFGRERRDVATAQMRFRSLQIDS